MHKQMGAHRYKLNFMQQSFIKTNRKKTKNILTLTAYIIFPHWASIDTGGLLSEHQQNVKEGPLWRPLLLFWGPQKSLKMLVGNISLLAH